MINKFSYKTQIIFLIITSFIALSGAYISQYFFGLKPCPLCIYQRIPFFIIIAFGIAALIFPKLQKIILICCAIALLSNCLIAFYHVGVEQKIFKGLQGCINEDLNKIDDIDALTNEILNSSAIRCDKPQFIFLKISMAGWNLIYCAFILLILAISNQKTNRPDQQ